jgi:hypothetical protein
MTTLFHHCVGELSDERESARSQWRKRVLLVGGGFQVAFGAWWLVRGLAPLTSLLVAGLVGVLVVLGGITVTSSVLASAPRPQGTEASRIERRLSVATVLQLTASVLVPWGLDSLHWHRLSLGFVMASIGLLLIWIHREVDSPFQGTAGTILVGFALVTVGLSGSAQTVVAGISSAAVLLSCAGAGYHWLEHHELED